MVGEVSVTYVCVNCAQGYGVDPGSCGVCGGMTRSVDEPTAATTEPVVETEVPTRSERLQCSRPDCRQSIPDGASECIYCGTPATFGFVVAPEECYVLVAPDGTEIPLRDGAPILIGRNPEISRWARLADGNLKVSGRHAEVLLSAGTLHVRDLGSTNGTWVSGVRIDGAAAVAVVDGIKIGFSRHLDLVVRSKNGNEPDVRSQI